MANEIGPIPYTTGLCLYVELFNESHQVWDVLSGHWESYSASYVDRYDLELTEISTAGLYLADLPGTIAIADVAFGVAKVKIAGTGNAAAVTDPVVGCWTPDVNPVLRDTATFSQSVDDRTKPSGTGDLAAILAAAGAAQTAAETVDTLTKTGGDGDLKALKTTVDANLDTKASDVLSAAAAGRDFADTAASAAVAVQTLTAASGDGDLAAMKTVMDAIDTLTKAAGDGDLAAVLSKLTALHTRLMAMIEADGDTYRFKANAVEQAPSPSIATESTVVTTR